MFTVMLSIWISNTLSLVTVIARMERTHSIMINDAKANLYKFIITGDDNYKKDFSIMINISLFYSTNFGQILDIIKTPESEKTIVKTFAEADQNMAKIMISRVRILFWHPIIKNLIKIASELRYLKTV